MCIKKVACGLKKVVKEDGRTVLEPIFVEVETPEDMHSITGKIESCKTVTPKVVEENAQARAGLALTVQNEQEVQLVAPTVTPKVEHVGTHDGDQGGHGSEFVGTDAIVSPITDNVSPTDNNVSPITDIVSPTDNNVSPTDAIVSPTPREVVCIETGEVFANATQASLSTGIARQSIGACCNGKRKSCGGYHWKYL